MLNGALDKKQSDNNHNHDTEKESGLVMPFVIRSIRRRTSLRRCGRHAALLAIVTLLLVLIQTTTAMLPGGKWLEHRLRRLAQAHIIEAPPTEPLSASLGSGGGSGEHHPPEADEQSSPLLVVATHEGQVWTIDSTDGQVVAGFSTGPPLLVVDDHYEEATMDNPDGAFPAIPEGLAQSQIVPSMDGILYWRQPTTTTERSSSSDSSSEHQNSKLVPIASIRDLVDNPIQMCQEIDGRNCDILTATSLGPSLFSLNSQGSLNWARARSSATTARVKPVPIQRKPSGSGDDTDDDSTSTSSSDGTANSSTSKTNLLLQRQDYLVQQISTETGEQVWNITWGSLESLDFMGDERSDDDSTGAAATSRRRSKDQQQSFHFLPSDDEAEDAASSDLPSLIFANQGKSLVALWTEPPKFLWKRDFISVITKVFGIERDTWQSVKVVAEIDDAEGIGGGSGKRRRSSRQILQPLLPDREETQAEKESFKYWWWAGGAKGLGKDNKLLDLENFYIHPNQDNGLIFVPRPHANTLVRNSWYLNHLWDSPQARGAQSFQGFLSAGAHNNNKQSETQSDKQSQPRPTKREASKEAQAYSVPQFPIETFYDTSNMPKLLLLPPSEPLPSPTNAGGLFLSWPVVVAIVTFLVGTAGAAFIVYGQKKRKWMATSVSPENSANNNNSAQTIADLTSETLSLSATRTRSHSVTAATERSHSRSKDPSRSGLSGSERNAGIAPSLHSLGKPPRYALNRSCSAPIITNDDIPSFTAPPAAAKTNLMSHTSHGTETSASNNISSLPKVEKEAPPSPADVAKGALIKHQSAPVEVPPPSTAQGVGMIDGIPLIRYSRYQSEFREFEPLGRGGFGSVFRVANVLDGREYAVKKVSIRSSDWSSPGTEAFSQELHRVLREVKFLALLDHPNIVRYYTAWLEMEENEKLPTGEESNANTNTLSRRFSSELLTGLDTDDNGENVQCQATTSFLGSSKPSASTSKATLSHLKPKKDANPLGWNNNFANFEDSSVSAFHPRYAMPTVPDSEDCGFIFEERSDDEGEEEDQDLAQHANFTHSFGGHSVTSSEYSKSEHSHSVSSSWDASYSLNRRQKNAASDGVPAEEKKGGEAADRRKRNSKTSRHTLYIQMQLCSPETLGDFLGNKEARQGPAQSVSAGSETVDIPLALRLFLQIVQAVHHVHQRNLIHRDLKPSNCFIDEMGTVKVGDFGLSRESNDNNENSTNSSLILDGQQDVQGAGDNTVGVGTRSYASPEQMEGSDYDAKTDIFALGMMLFELLYPMYTGMERHICFQKLRTESSFPDGWHSTVCKSFPSLDELVKSMLSRKPKDRPAADKVARQIQALIEEHSVTLNISRHDSDHENLVYVRVEAQPVPDVLKVVIDRIHEAAAPEAVEVVQYGMRSATKKTSSSDEKPERRAILEFALGLSTSDTNSLSTTGSLLVAKLQEHDEILLARHVWHHAALANWGNRPSR